MFVAVLSTYENHVLIVLYNKTKYVQEVQNNIVGSTYSLQKQSLLMYILYSYEMDIKISCDNKLVPKTKIVKFLGLYVDSSVSWKTHIEQMMCKLNRACYAIRYVKHFMSQDILRTIYFSYFHSILSYGIIFWGNSSHSSNIFKIQKKAIRIIMNASIKDSCHQLFKILKILPLKSQYIFSLLLFVAKNRDLYESNSEIHNVNTRYSSDLHTPMANLATFQKGPITLELKYSTIFPLVLKNHLMT